MSYSLLEAMKELKEDVNSSMLATILPHDDVYNFIENVKPGEFFNVGYLKELKPAAEFVDGGRGHINKETGESKPVIRVFKATEMYGSTGVDYESKQSTIDYRAATGKERSGLKFAYESALENKIGFIGKDHNEALKFFPRTTSRPKTKYWVSIDGGDLVEIPKAEVAQYMPASFMAERPTDENNPTLHQFLLLNRIYWIGDLGQSIIR